MGPYSQKWPRIITMHDWLAMAHPGVPFLLWLGDDGREICSFAVERFEHAGGILVLL